MKNIIRSIFTLIALVSCQNNSVSEADKKKAIELNDQAVELIIDEKVEEAQNLYEQAHEIDKSNPLIHRSLIGVYVKTKEFDKAFELLEELPEEIKNSAYYYQAKGGIFEMKGDMGKAQENFIKAYEVSELDEIESEIDLNTLVNYAMAEAVAGHKQRALNRLNEALKTDWLKENHIEFLETFRNEVEFYKGTGSMDFGKEKEIKICTTNIDSLVGGLKKHHINISGSSSAFGGNEMGNISVTEKYRSGIEKLGLKECE